MSKFIYWAINQSLPPPQKLTLILLAYHASDEGYVCKSTATLSKKTGLSRPTIVRCLNALIKCNLIKIIRQISGNPTSYLLSISNKNELSTGYPQEEKLSTGYQQGVYHSEPGLGGGCITVRQGVYHSDTVYIKQDITKYKRSPPYPPRGGAAGAAEEDVFFSDDQKQKIKSSATERKAQRIEKMPSWLELSHELDAGDCPYDFIADIYHTELPFNPRQISWTKKRKKRLAEIWEDYFLIRDWNKFFEIVSQSKFLTGRVIARNGKPFLPSLEWLINEDNFFKIIEGNYS